MKYLIVNADDFGLSDDINEGILIGHRAGSITNATLMIKRGSVEDAVQIAKDNPLLCVGLHLDLDEYLGRDEKGAERFGLKRISQMLSDRSFLKSVEDEIDFQIMKFKETGLQLTHIDGHHHLHAIPEIFPMIIEKMKLYGIRTIRFSGEFDLIKYPPIRWERGFLDRMKALIPKSGIRVADTFVTGWMPYDLQKIGDGVTELMTHPGTREDWRIKELDMLVSKEWIDTVRENKIKLISFRELAAMKNV